MLLIIALTQSLLRLSCVSSLSLRLTPTEEVEVDVGGKVQELCVRYLHCGVVCRTGRDNTPRQGRGQHHLRTVTVSTLYSVLCTLYSDPPGTGCTITTETETVTPHYRVPDLGGGRGADELGLLRSG